MPIHSFPFVLHIPQPKIEQLLEEHALELGVSILRDHHVQRIEQNEAGVSVEGTCSDGTIFEATARYLIGADGGRGTIRKAANISFDGHDPTCKYILADVEFNGSLEVPPTFVVNPDGSGNSLIVGFGDGIHHRVILIDPQHIGRDPKVPMTEDELRDSVSRLRPGLSIKSSLWISQFTDETKIAGTYQSGKVFLAGDAAHLHLSAGGHGMNRRTKFPLPQPFLSNVF
jgi:2-polyprenyl-6-methoxyphenol hydroxylase-like FAD-dependent oxidoreductase